MCAEKTAQPQGSPVLVALAWTLQTLEYQLTEHLGIRSLEAVPSLLWLPGWSCWLPTHTVNYIGGLEDSVEP